MPRKLDLMLEAERRGILPEDKAELLAEARRRGLISEQGKGMFGRETTGAGGSGFGAGRFALETGGILAGARMGAPLGIPGALLGAGFGFAGAKRAGKSVAQMIGAEPPSGLPLEQQILESIKTLPRDVVVGAASQAVGPFARKAITGAGKEAAFPFVKIGRGVKNLLARSGVPQELTQEIFEHPSTFFRKGSPEKVAETVSKVVTALDSAKQKVMKLYDRAKRKSGITETTEMEIQRMAGGEFRPISPKQLSSEYINLREDLKSLSKTPISPFTKAPRKIALKKLFDLRRQVDQSINWDKMNRQPIDAEEVRILQAIRSGINSRILELPGGKLLRQADKKYGDVIEQISDLQAQFSDIAKGGSAMESVAKTGGSVRAMLKSQETLKNLRGFEGSTGEELVQPFIRESAALASEPLIPMSGFMSPFLGEAAVAGAGMAAKPFTAARPMLNLAGRAATSQFATRGLALQIMQSIMERTPVRPPVRDLREMTTLQP